MHDQQLALVLVCVMLFFGGCRKDKDGSPPTITIMLPLEGHVISIPDTLVVQVTVSDDRIVENVQISLADVNGVPISPPVSVAVGSPSATIVRDLVVADERILGGNYTLTVRASDGTNDRRAFRTVSVLAAPLRLRSLFIAPPAGSSPAIVTRIDSVGQLSTWTVMEDIHGAAVDGYSQHLFLAGGLNAPLFASSTSSGSFPWQIPNLNATGLPYFNGPRMDPEDGRFYFSTNDGFIRGFSGEGSPTFTATAMAGSNGELTSIVGGRVLCVQRNMVQGTLDLVSLALISGQQIALFPMDLDTVIAMDRRTDEHALIFGNRDGKGVIQDRNAFQGGVFEIQVFDEGAITDVVRLDGQNWAIALPERIARFTYASGSTAPLATIPGVRALATDAATGILYAGSGDQLLFIDPNTGATTGSITCPTAVGFVLPLLNR